MILKLPQVSAALAVIRERGLDKVRCSLTGAPWADIDSDEISLAIEGDLADKPLTSVDRLVDLWELRLLAMSSQPSPMLRGVNDKSLVPLLSRGATGNVRLMTYLLTRLFYPALGTQPQSSQFLQERMGFARECYDFYVLEHPESGKVNDMVQKLIAVDSYCAMPYWHKLWIFESRFSKYGLENAEPRVRQAFADPTSVLADSKAIPAVIKFLFDLMLYASGNDSVVGKSGNRLSQQLLMIDGSGVRDVLPAHMKRELSQADIERMAKNRAINNRQELRVAHSAIHGPGVAPGGKPTPRPKKAKVEKPKTAFETQFAAAFASLAANVTFNLKKKD